MHYPYYQVSFHQFIFKISKEKERDYSRELYTVRIQYVEC